MFKTYDQTRLNIIPLIHGEQKKVYVLTGPQKSGVVIFGNDYLFEFDENDQIIIQKSLHQNIIPIEYQEDRKGDVTIHSHVAQTGHLLTASDICTLMLYQKYAGWKSHYVMSPKYVNIWDCQSNNFIMITRKAFQKVSKIQAKIEKKRKKSQGKNR